MRGCSRAGASSAGEGIPDAVPQRCGLDNGGGRRYGTLSDPRRQDGPLRLPNGRVLSPIAPRRQERQTGPGGRGCIARRLRRLLMELGTFRGFDASLEGGGILLVSFNQPERLNGMTQGLKRDLAEILAEAQMEDAVRVVVITGS